MLLTIAIPIYNGEKYLPQMVDSILGQSYRNYELLLVDDGSTDKSSIICDTYADLDPRVTVIHKKNEGICKSRNLAINLAKGEYLCFYDQDDRLFPNTLKKFVDAINLRKADFYVGGYRNRIENISGQAIELRDVCCSDMYLSSANDIRNFYLEHITDGIVAPIWNIVYSVNYLRTHKLYFDETLKQGLEDLEFNIKSYFLAQHIQVISNIGIEYYIRAEGSTSQSYNIRYIEQCENIIKKLNRNVNKYGMISDFYNQQIYKFLVGIYIINGFQNIVYASKFLGRKKTYNEIKQLMNKPFTGVIVSNVDKKQLSRYNYLIIFCIHMNSVFMLYIIIKLKDLVRRNILRKYIKSYFNKN